MIPYFTPSSNDQSIYYLYQIFGNVGNLFQNAQGTGQASMVLGTMFKTFNTFVLAVGTLIIIYVTVVGIMKTASEGEFLGKQWNSIWLPIRMVIGIAALVPTASGYSSIQIVMMWIILQGIGAADTVWTTVLGYSDTLGSPLSTISIPSVGVSNNMQTLFQGLVCQESARANYDLTSTGRLVTTPFGMSGKTAGGYYCNPLINASFSGSCSSGNFCACSEDSSQLWNITGPLSSSSGGGQYTYSMGPNGHCGTVTFCSNVPECNDTTQVANLIKCNACKAQAGALQEVVNVMAPIARQFVQADYEYRNFLLTKEVPSWLSNYCAANGGGSPDTCCITPVSGAAGNQKQSKCIIPRSFDGGSDQDANGDVVNKMILPYSIQNLTGNIDFITASVNDYVNSLSNAAMSAIQQAVQNKTSFSKAELNEALSVGWIFAGAYYYYLAQGNNKNVEAALPILTVNTVSPSSNKNNPLSNLRNNYNAAGTLMYQISNQAASAQGGNTSFSQSLPTQLKQLSALSDGLADSTKSVMDVFYKWTSGAKAGTPATNPLMQLQTLGKVLLIIAQVLFALIMYVTFALTLVGYFNVFVLGSGVTNALGPVVTTLGVLFAPLLAVFLGALFAFGALLAVYTPLIPYIIFTMGAITWFILVIEAMIAAPLIAIGILSPSGHHEVLGKAEGALMYIFSLFLRPTLMIFGLIAAMLLSVVVVTMINAAFSGVMAQIYSNPGGVEILLFLGAYVSLVLTALNKCFALIHIVPDRVLRWIGGHAEESGTTAGEALSGVKGGVSATGKQVRGMGADMKARGDKGKGEIKEMGEKRRAQKEGEVSPDISETKEGKEEEK